MFLREAEVSHHRDQISCNTLYDRFNRLIAERREGSRRNVLTSANVECNSSFEEELDSTIKSIDHFEDGNKNEAANQNAASAEAGLRIRLEALQRSAPPARTADSDEELNLGSASSSERKRLFENSDDEEKEMIMHHAGRREEREK